MDFDRLLITTRTKFTPFRTEASFAGAVYREHTYLFDPNDRNISLVLVAETVPDFALLVTSVYTGRFLDQVLRVGKEDFQLFRVHYGVYDTRFVERKDWETYGELLEERPVPWKNQIRTLYYEHLCGYRHENQSLLTQTFLDFDPVLEENFVKCPLPLTESPAEYSRHQTWHPHPGIVNSTDRCDWIEQQMHLAQPVSKVM